MQKRPIRLPLFIALFAAACLACAQDAPPNQPKTRAEDTPDPAAKISVQVNVVNVLATVRDKHGKIVNNLTKDDFTITEDGRPQSIHYFSRDTNLPLTLGLLVDTSLSQRRVLEQERSASHSFLDQMVREDRDKAFLIHFDREVELLQDLTSSHQKLEQALNALKTPEYTATDSNAGGGNWPGGGGGQRGSGRHGGHHGGGTALYDAVFLASDELMSKQQGRKALVLLTDGVDRGSKESLDSAIESAQRANTVVYAILFKDDESYGNGGGFGRPSIGFPGGGYPGGRRGGGQRYPEQQHPDGKKVLERISKETGGRLFEVSRKKPIDQIYTDIAEELRNQYNLGYTPDRDASNSSSYHKIQLSAKQKDLIVQARDGYYGNR